MDFIKWPYRRVSDNKAYGDAKCSGNVAYLKKIVTMRQKYLKSVWE